MTSAAAPEAGRPWTVMGLIRWSGEYLQGKGVSSGRLDAEHLLAHALGKERLQLYLEFDRPLQPAELAAFKPALQRRARREPLQYILGRTAFRELDLAADPRALIPRPETEGLVELVLDWVGALDRPASALDVGTGTGAIALSLAVEGRFSRIVATDVSSDALDLARENRDRLGLGERVEFRLGPTWTPLSDGERFDVIVSNPPYVSEAEMGNLEPEVALWEPRAALAAGDRGLAVLEPLVDGAADRLAPGGLLALELGAGQGGTVLTRTRLTAGLCGAQLKRDLAGRERYVLAHRAGGDLR